MENDDWEDDPSDVEYFRDTVIEGDGADEGFLIECSSCGAVSPSLDNVTEDGEHFVCPECGAFDTE